MRYVVWILLFFSCVTLHAQEEVTLTVLDAADYAPISNTHILLLNTTHSFYTDQDGQSVIPQHVLRGSEVIFSHISYELYNKQFDIELTLSDTIYLDKSAQVLSNVTVRGKKSNLKKERLGLLENVLFGKRKRNSKIQNSEVILFREEDGQLSASADELIKIENTYLGYEIFMYLEEFERGSDLTSYSGKTFFRDYDVSKKRKKKYLKRRASIEALGQRRFLRSLLSSTTLDDFRVSTNNIPEVRPDDLRQFVYQTTIDDVYALVFPMRLIIEKKRKRSSLYSENGLIVFDSKGNILNQGDVEVDGYWNELGISELLPNENSPLDPTEMILVPHKRYSMSELLVLAQDRLEKVDPLIEEVTIHTDRLLYMPGEEVYLSARLFDHYTQELLLEDETLDIEVIGPDSKRIIRKTVLCQNGLVDLGITMPKDSKQGQYMIRAYTNYMKSFGVGLYGEAVIGLGMIKDFDRKDDQTASNTQVDFYPEGGHLIADQDNRVLFTVQRDGEPQEYDGVLLDATSGKEYHIKTIVPGIGTVQIDPTTDSDFKIAGADVEKLTAKNGATLSVFTREQDYFSAKVIGSQDGELYDLNIIVRGKVLFSMKDVEANKMYRLEKSFLPQRMLTFQLSTKDSEVISERVVDNSKDHGLTYEFSPNQQSYQPGQQVLANIDLSQLPNVDTNLVWSVSVAHSEYTTVDNGEKEVFEAPSYTKTGDLSYSNQQYIRNLSLIGARLSEEHTVAYAVEEEDIQYQRTTNQKISGQITDSDGAPIASSMLSVSSLTEDFYYDEVETDENGRFVYEKVPYRANTPLLLQARKSSGKEESMYDGDRNVNIKIDDPMSTEVVVPFERLSYLRDFNMLDSSGQNLGDFAWSESLENVTISGRKYRPKAIGSLLMDISQFENIPEQLNMVTLVRKFYPGSLLRENRKFDRLEVRKLSTDGFYDWQPVGIVINGNSEQGLGRFKSLVADQIQYMGFSQYGTIILITTPNYKGRSEIAALSKGVYVHHFPENIRDTYFVDYTPTADVDVEDLRKTLLWRPQQTTNSEGKLDLSFYTSDVTGAYDVILRTVHPEYGPIELREQIIVDEVK